MREQIADGDVIPVWAVPRCEVSADAIVETDQTPFHLLYGNRRRRQHLGERGEVEDRIGKRQRRVGCVIGWGRG